MEILRKVLSLGIATLLLSGAAHAAETSWKTDGTTSGGVGGTNGSNGNWSDPARWTLHVPQSGDDALIALPNANVTLNTATPLLNSVRLEGTVGQGSTLTVVTGASLNAVGMTVGGGVTANPSGGVAGQSSDGAVVQTGGSVSITSGPAELIVGDAPGSSGSYSISGGSLTAGSLFIGVGANSGATRSFTHTGGAVTVNSDFQVGVLASSAGTYNLGGASSPVLTAAVGVVGASGSGTFNQTGGVFNLTLTSGAEDDGTLYVGALNAGGTGAYNLSSGELNAKVIWIGNPGQGTFTQSGGTVTTSELLVDVGGDNSQSSLGTYKISNGSLTTSATGPFKGLDIRGKFEQTGGTVTTNGNGFYNGGAYTLSAGTLTGSGEKLNAGVFSASGTTGIISGAGAFVNEGTVTLAGNATLTLDANFSIANIGILQSAAGSTWKFGLNVSIASTQRNIWDTDASTLLFFAGTGNAAGNHVFTSSAQDVGASYAGFNDNLGWDRLVVETGNELVNTSGVVYTDVLQLADGVGQIASFTGSMKIYYDPTRPENSYLNGQTYNFGTGGGLVAPVPEPSAILLASVGAVVLGMRRRRA